MKTDTLKIVFHRNARTEKNFTASVIKDDHSLQPLENVDLSGKTLSECINLLKDKFDIVGFLSYKVIVPLTCLISEHDQKICLAI